MGNSTPKSNNEVNSAASASGPTIVKSKYDTYRVVPFGRPNVGKTSLIRQFVMKVFSESYEPTVVEDTLRAEITLADKSVTAEILDAGDLEGQEMQDLFMRKGDGFLLVYSVTDRTSFTYCTALFEKIQNMKAGESPLVILVGNKSDAGDRVVSTAEGEELAKQHGWLFFETSAKNNMNVDAVFHEIAQIIDEHVVITVRKKKAQF